ncbi:MAG: NusG domain II-containing protein, partial [Bacillota bacterium]|nr:NusG domain II-containing protein [Bacillota bacterium]
LFVIFLRMPSQNVTAVITVDGRVKNKIVLSGLKDPLKLSFSNLGYTNVVLAENGKIRVLSADCPDKVCVRTGFISRPGQSIVCLPSRLVIRLEGESKSGLDAVVG